MTGHVADPPRRPSIAWLGLAGFGAAVATAALIGGLGVAGASAEYQPGPAVVGTAVVAAAVLLLPYWAWVTFATALNAAASYRADLGLVVGHKSRITPIKATTGPRSAKQDDHARGRQIRCGRLARLD